MRATGSRVVAGGPIQVECALRIAEGGFVVLHPPLRLAQSEKAVRANGGRRVLQSRRFLRRAHGTLEFTLTHLDERPAVQRLRSQYRSLLRVGKLHHRNGVGGGDAELALRNVRLGTHIEEAHPVGSRHVRRGKRLRAARDGRGVPAHPRQAMRGNDIAGGGRRRRGDCRRTFAPFACTRTRAALRRRHDVSAKGRPEH